MGDSQRQGSILSPLQTHLDESIWHPDDTLKDDVKNLVLNGINEIITNFAPDPITYVLRVVIIGSITGLQYEDDADVDVNVLVDVDQMAEDLSVDPEALRIQVRKKFIEQNGHPVPGTAHPVNYFLSVDETYPPADGIYDLFSDSWIKKPGQMVPDDYDPYLSLEPALDRAESVAEKIDVKWGQIQRAIEAMNKYPRTADTHKRQAIRGCKYLDRLADNLHEERQEVFDLAKKQGLDAPQMSTANVVYKAQDHWGKLDILHKAKKILKMYQESGSLELGDDNGIPT